MDKETISDIIKFVMGRKKFWLVPMLFILFVLGFAFIFSSGTVFAPLIYTVF